MHNTGFVTFENPLFGAAHADARGALVASGVVRTDRPRRARRLCPPLLRSKAYSAPSEPQNRYPAKACLREQPFVCMRRSIASSICAGVGWGPPLSPSPGCCRALVNLACSDFDFSTFRFHVPISGLLCADATCGNDAIPNPKSISISMVRRFMMFLPGSVIASPIGENEASWTS